MKRPQILAVDDEPALLRIIKDSLYENYDVTLTTNAQDALASFLKKRPDLILVDNLMPGTSGLEFVKTIRISSDTLNIPIIMITVLYEAMDRIEAFKAGVDDFISKPFNPEELVVRIESRLSRYESIRSKPINLIRLGNLAVDFENHSIVVNGQPIHLTQIELIILEKLIKNLNHVVTRIQLEHAIWEKSNPDGRILDIHIATLRKKIKECDRKIETVYGKGYVIRNHLA